VICEVCGYCNRLDVWTRRWSHERSKTTLIKQPALHCTVLPVAADLDGRRRLRFSDCLTLIVTATPRSALDDRAFLRCTWLQYCHLPAELHRDTLRSGESLN